MDLQEIIRNASDINGLESKYINDKIFFDTCIELNRFDLAKYCSGEFFDSFVLDKYGEQFIEAFAGELPKKLKYYPEISMYCAKKKRFDLVCQFELIWDEVLIGNEVEIANHLKKLSGSMCEDKELLKVLLANGKFDLITEFYDRIFDDEIIKCYSLEIIDRLFQFRTNYNLLQNSTLLCCVLENKRYDLVENFYPKAFTEEIFDLMIDGMQIQEIPITFKFNSLFLKKVIAAGKIDWLDDFFPDAFTVEMMDDLAKILKNVPFFLQIDPLFLRKVIENNRFELLEEFNSYAISVDIFNDYGELLKEKIPFDIIIRSRGFLSWCLKNKERKYYSRLSLELIDESIIQENDLDLLFFIKMKLLNLKNEELIVFLNNTKILLDYLLDKGEFSYLEKFDVNDFDEDIIDKHLFKIIDWLEKDLENNVPVYLSRNHILRNKLIELNKKDLYLKFIVPNELLDNEILLEKYADSLNLTSEELKNKIEIIFKKNDEILNTLIPLTLSNKMSCIRFEHLEKFAVYNELQVALCNLDRKNIEIFARILDFLDNVNCDITGIIYEILENINEYNELLSSINVEKISEEQLGNLISILQKKENLYQITDSEQLFNDSLQNIKREFFYKMDHVILEVDIDLQNLKEILLERKFGLGIDKVEFIYQRYCKNLDSIKNSNISSEIYLILNEIKEIYLCEDLELLKFLNLVTTRIDTDFYSVVSLESSIRKEFAKLYSDSLYKLKEENKLSKDVVSEEVFYKLKNSFFNGISPQFYIMDGDFNLQVHSLGAYSYYEKPDNFKDDWLRPKIASHGICTAYIRNDQIASARTFHPILGFARYEDSALLLMANYDIYSSKANLEYATSMHKSGSFFPPQDMPNYTRHNHNEMVMERRDLSSNDNFKRMPDYVVYLVDDVNNKYNFYTREQLLDELSLDENVENKIRAAHSLHELKYIKEDIYVKFAHAFLYEETIQASVDFGIPILIVDRLKYVKSEHEKCVNLEEKFVHTLDTKYLNEMFLKYFNNMVGCRKFLNQGECEYHSYFNDHGFVELYNRVLDVIKGQYKFKEKVLDFFSKNSSIMLYANLLKDFVLILKLENGKREDDSLSPYIEELLDLLKKLRLDLENEKIELQENEDNKKRIIVEFYYKTSEEIRKK